MSSIDSVLDSCVADGKLLVIQPGGNFGDQLIYMGLEKRLARTGIQWCPLRDRRSRHDAPHNFSWMNARDNARALVNRWRYLRHKWSSDISAVYIHGGGNFNDLWSEGVKCYNAAATYFSCPIIVGPQSCSFEHTNPAQIFRDVSNETHFFCREQYSYELMANVAMQLDHVDVHLEDDTALFLDAGDLPVTDCTNEYTLLAFRGDKESSNPTIERTLTPPLKVSDISTSAPTFEQFVDAAARAELILTDRLHCAILGTILSKEVIFYGNSYHKNRGVYEYSLADNSNVTFIRSGQMVASSRG